MRLLLAAAFSIIVLHGCSAGATRKGDNDAKLVGARAPLISDGLSESIYFTHLDGRELRSVFNQYPSTVSVSPGAHTVTVVCEWREKSSEAPVAKHVRRFRMDVDQNRVIQFESSFEGAGGCQLGFRDVTDQKTASPGR
jgi:hypothetical protein